MHEISVEGNNEFTRREELLGGRKVFGKNNKIFVSGTIFEEPKFSHEIIGKKFYTTKVEVSRLNGISDILPVIIPEPWLSSAWKERGLVDRWVEIAGQVRTSNFYGADGKSHLNVYILARDIRFYESDEELIEMPNSNVVYFEGTICKKPNFKVSPRGKRITEIILAVNGKYNRSEYVPCICWENLAEASKKFEVSDKLRILGRMQSREYGKKVSEDSEEAETKTTYEVSVYRMHKVK